MSTWLGRWRGYPAFVVTKGVISSSSMQSTAVRYALIMHFKMPDNLQHNSDSLNVVGPNLLLGLIDRKFFKKPEVVVRPQVLALRQAQTTAHFPYGQPLLIPTN
jgi:hypothetical protein